MTDFVLYFIHHAGAGAMIATPAIVFLIFVKRGDYLKPGRK